MRKPFRMMRLAAALAAAAVSQSGRAQPAAETPEPQASLYQVEVIVFEHTDADPGEELFRPRPPAAAQRLPEAELRPLELEPIALPQAPAPDATVAPADPAAAAAAGASPSEGAPETPAAQAQAQAQDAQQAAAAPDPLDDPSAPFRFRILEPEELKLNGAYRTLERVDAYTPLVHGGWIQQGLPEEQARAFDLAYLGTLNPSGTIRLHVSRFLHVTLDLSYRPGAQAGTPALPSSPLPFELSELSLGPRYALTTSRRVRSNELNYFDHPRFGVLVMIAPYEPPAPPPGSESGEVGPAA